MKPIVYVETSVVSYLTARPSRDLDYCGAANVDTRMVEAGGASLDPRTVHHAAWKADCALSRHVPTSEIKVVMAARGDFAW